MKHGMDIGYKPAQLHEEIKAQYEAHRYARKIKQSALCTWKEY